MSKFIEFLDGKKTYIQAAAGAVVMGLFWAGMIDESIMKVMVGSLGFGITASIRSGINRQVK